MCIKFKINNIAETLKFLNFGLYEIFNVYTIVLKFVEVIGGYDMLMCDYPKPYIDNEVGEMSWIVFWLMRGIISFVYPFTLFIRENNLPSCLKYFYLGTFNGIVLLHTIPLLVYSFSYSLVVETIFFVLYALSFFVYILLYVIKDVYIQNRIISLLVFPQVYIQFYIITQSRFDYLHFYSFLLSPLMIEFYYYLTRDGSTLRWWVRMLGWCFALSVQICWIVFEIQDKLKEY